LLKTKILYIERTLAIDMMKKLFVATVLGMLFLGVMLPVSTAQRTVYHNDKYGFSIAPPIGWEIEERLSDDLPTIIFWGPRENNYQVRMVIIITEFDENVPDLSLIDFAEGFTEGFTEGLPDTQVISERGRMINGMEAYEITYTSTVTIEDEVFDLQTKVVILSHDGVVYTITFFAPQDSYNEYLPLFEESVGTVKFEEKGLLQKIFDMCCP